MNFIDHFNQDQEEAKSALTAALNQKAFDLLDTYADNSEVEVVTFEDEEANESVEELDESGDYDSHYNAGKTAALDGKGAASCPHKKGDVNSDLQRKAWLMGHKDYKPRKAKEYKFEESDEAEYEELYEGLGSLAGLSKHLIKTVTKDPYSGRQAGEHSDVETHPIKNKSAHREVLNKALDAGHVPVVYVNGKIHSAGHSTGNIGGRPEYHIHDADKQREQKETRYPKPYRSGGKFVYPPSHQISNPRYKKGDALDQLTPGHEASFYKENKVEVKVIKQDKERLKKMKARGENRPSMQTNTVKMTPDEKAKKGYSYSDQKEVSKTPEGSMKAIKDAAALKLATKKLGTEGSSANKKAMDLHAELGKHLAAGKHREAIHAANQLADHVRNQGLETHADKIKDYAETLKGLKNSWGNKDYEHKKLAKMRGEKVDESEELTEALEAMLTDMLDINEAVVAGSVKKDDKGNVLSFKSVGDDKAKPRQSAPKFAAALHAHRAKMSEEVEEDAEQIDELSKDTLAAYKEKAISTMGKRVDHVGHPTDPKSVSKVDQVPKLKGLFLDYKNRNAKSLAKDAERTRIAKGIDTATRKLGEEVESIDEAKMFDPGKTVWTSHTEKALKGKIVKKDDDNAEHYIVLHKDGQHAVHQDHIHAKEEYAKYMLEQTEE